MILYERRGKEHVVVDWAYKRKGIYDLNPEENAKHVSWSEQAYMEAHMQNMRNDHHDNGPI
jgi:hypothetical protein